MSESGGNAESRPSSVHCATRSPSAPPAAQKTRHSTIDWRRSCPRPAPIARRIPYSRCLAAPRAASRPARFEQAMSRTSATMPISETSGFPTPSRRTERPVPAGQELELLLDELLAGLVVPSLEPGRELRQERAVEGRQPRLRLSAREARLQAADDLDPVVLRIVQAVPERRHLRLLHHRHEDVRGAAGLDSGEAVARDADDGQRLPVDDDRLVQDGGVRAESARPVAVGEDGDRMGAGRAIVGRRQRPAERRHDAEHVERVPAHELSRGAFGRSARAHARVERKLGHESREDVAPRREIPVHRVRERRRDVRIAPAVPLDRAVRAQQHELARVAHREQRQEHPIDEREDRRVGADSERERDHGGRGEAGRRASIRAA